ncbi:hypothetical protein Tco_0342235, partial [Tanacetum coccineum]
MGMRMTEVVSDVVIRWSHGGDGARCGDDDDGGVGVVRRRCGGGLV